MNPVSRFDLVLNDCSTVFALLALDVDGGEKHRRAA